MKSKTGLPRGLLTQWKSKFSKCIEEKLKLQSGNIYPRKNNSLKNISVNTAWKDLHHWYVLNEEKLLKNHSDELFKHFKISVLEVKTSTINLLVVQDA